MVNILTYLFLSWAADLLTVSFFFHLIRYLLRVFSLELINLKHMDSDTTRWASDTASKPFRGITKVN